MRLKIIIKVKKNNRSAWLLDIGNYDQICLPGLECLFKISNDIIDMFDANT